MAGKPILHYSNDRGRMESIRWLLAAAGVETKGTLFLDTQPWTISGSLVCQIGAERENFRYEEKYIETRQDLEKLRNDGVLVFQQVPMVEIDGMKLVQTRAILNYIANKHNLYGKDIKERALIDMYAEGIADLNELIILYPFRAPGEKDANFTQIQDKARNRYFLAFEKVLKSHGQDYLVGNKLSKVDIHLAELLYNVEELDPSIITSFPLLQALKTRISSLPTVKKFLQSGSQRKPPVDDKCVEKVFKIFH